MVSVQLPLNLSSVDFCEPRIPVPIKIMWEVEDGFPGQPVKGQESHQGPWSFAATARCPLEPRNGVTEAILREMPEVHRGDLCRKQRWQRSILAWWLD